jgi:Uma2 family endonuclease
MNRYVVRVVDLTLVIDSEETSNEVVAENFLARLAELTQSEEHLLDGEVYAMHLPGNKHPMEGAEMDLRSS